MDFRKWGICQQIAQVINTTTDPKIWKNGVYVLSSLFLAIEPRNIIDAKIEIITFAEIFKRQKD